MMVPVALPGAQEITEMDDSELLKLEGSSENDNEIVAWVQYHLPASGELVHRSANVHLKLPVGANGEAAKFGE